MINEDDFSEITGIGKKTEEKLKNAGFKTYEDLKKATLGQLTSVKGIYNATAEKIKNHFKGESSAFNDKDVIEKNPLKTVPLNNLDKYVEKNKTVNTVKNKAIFSETVKSNNSPEQEKVNEINEVHEEIENDSSEEKDGEFKVEKLDELKYEEEIYDENIPQTPDIDEIASSLGDKEEEIEENNDSLNEEKIDEIDNYNEFPDSIEKDSESENLKRKNYNETVFNGDLTKLPDISRLLNGINDNNNGDLSNVINQFMDGSESEVKNPLENEKNSLLEKEETENYQKELLSDIESQEMLFNIKETFKVKKYHMFTKKLKGADVLAIKSALVKDLVNHIIIIPIKILRLKGSVIVSKEDVKYIPLNTIDKQSQIYIQKEHVVPDVKKILKLPKFVYDDIYDENSIFKFLKSYLKLNITPEKSRFGTVLFFRDGMLQYKIFVEPIIICQSETHSGENSIMFPYFFSGNLHVINCNQLQDLIDYIEIKHKTIEKYDKGSNNDILNYFKSKNKTLSRLTYVSFPFVLYGVIFMVITLLQLYGAIRVFILLSYGVISLYGLIVSYLYYIFYSEKKEILNKTNEPYFKRKIEIDEYDMNFLKEELNHEMLKQFSYESISFENNLKLQSSIINITSENIEENTTIEIPLEKNPLRISKKSKYGTFLED